VIVVKNDSLSEQAIRRELAKLLTSQIFARSERLGRFLQFTVEQVLAGKQSELKEYVIGIEVYDRRSPYHPSIDSIVRTEARRLRGKLKEYYELDGKTDPVKILFRPGSYIPVFCLQEARVNGSREVAKVEASFTNTTDEIVISVDRFVDLSGASQAAICARGVTAEVLHLLMEIKGCRVVAPGSGSSHSIHSHLHLEGDIRQYDGSLRISCRLINGEGFQLTSQRLDVSAEAAGSFGLQEEIAAAVVSRITSIVKTMVTDSCSSVLARGRVISIVTPEKRSGAAFASS